MLSEKLLKALNEQVNFEFYSSYTYLAMAGYCESIDLSGFANFFRVQAKEELDHAKKIYLLTDIAYEEREHSTISLLKWFIDEQVEEENNFNALLKKVRRAGDNQAALYLLDDELQKRQYLSPQNV